MKYILIEWPEVQELMSYDDFDCQRILLMMKVELISMALLHTL
jgi:hypothetical protein